MDAVPYKMALTAAEMYLSAQLKLLLCPRNSAHLLSPNRDTKLLQLVCTGESSWYSAIRPGRLNLGCPRSSSTYLTEFVRPPFRIPEIPESCLSRLTSPRDKVDLPDFFGPRTKRFSTCAFIGATRCECRSLNRNSSKWDRTVRDTESKTVPFSSRFGGWFVSSRS